MNFKKVALSLVIALFTVTLSVFGQDDPNRSYKNANSALVSYNRTYDVTKLEEAKNEIDYAIENLDKVIEKKVVSVLMTQGDVYLTISKDQDLSSDYENALDIAYGAYEKVLKNENAKKYEISSAAKSLQDVANEYWNKGLASYDSQNYKGAYLGFNKVLEIHELVAPVDAAVAPLGGFNIDPTTGEQIEKYPEHLKNTAMLASAAGENEAAAVLYKKILESGDKTPSAYNGLYVAYAESDEELALEYLQEGRAAFPENTELLYSEINYFLKKGETKKLQENLAAAIAKDPDNKTLYSVLGNTYDNLMKDAEDDATRDAMKAEAIKYYEIALSKDPEYGDVIYSLGAMYYNEAVRFAKIRAALPYSAKKEYEAATKDFQDNIVLAHPYFVKSELIDPSDRSTIIALKELYAQANLIEISAEFKKRLAKVDAGESIEAAYDGHPSTAELFK